MPNFDRMLRTALNTFGESVTYTRGGQSVVIRKAVFDTTFRTIDPETGVVVQSNIPSLGVALADLPEGRAKEGDTVVRGGVTYRVIQQEADSEGHARLILKRA